LNNFIQHTLSRGWFYKYTTKYPQRSKFLKKSPGICSNIFATFRSFPALPAGRLIYQDRNYARDNKLHKVEEEPSGSELKRQGVHHILAENTDQAEEKPHQQSVTHAFCYSPIFSAEGKDINKQERGKVIQHYHYPGLILNVRAPQTADTFVQMSQEHTVNDPVKDYKRDEYKKTGQEKLAH
jgi:hypothetical protein